jgi:hypothetical protein
MSWETHSRKSQDDRERRFEAQRKRRQTRRQKMLNEYANSVFRPGDKPKESKESR